MHFSSAMVIDEHIKPKAVKKIMKKLKAQKSVKSNLMLIKVNPSKQLLEIVTYRELYRLTARNKDVAIIGIAKNREFAFELLEKIMANVYEHHQNITSDIIDKEFDLIWQS